VDRRTAPLLGAADRRRVFGAQDGDHSTSFHVPHPLLAELLDHNEVWRFRRAGAGRPQTANDFHGEAAATIRTLRPPPPRGVRDHIYEQRGITRWHDPLHKMECPIHSRFLVIILHTPFDEEWRHKVMGGFWRDGARPPVRSFGQ
jgi:hypothetical protein